jgi:hypothetical protein
MLGKHKKLIGLRFEETVQLLKSLPHVRKKIKIISLIFVKGLAG